MNRSTSIPSQRRARARAGSFRRRPEDLAGSTIETITDATIDAANDRDVLALQLTRSGLRFDLGCAHTLPQHGEAGRCQLWIGHHGEHAVMFVRAGLRMVRCWQDGSPPQVHDGADCRCQPWVYGFPLPAWHEGINACVTVLRGPDIDPDPGRPTGRTVADAMVRRPKVHPVTSTVGQLRQLFADRHVHAALIVADEVLITVVDRDDVRSALPANTPAASLGTLAGRTVAPTASLQAVRQQMTSDGRRRLAVIDEQQRLLGLLCLKRGQNGFCSDQDVQSRLAEAASYASDLAWPATVDGRAGEG